MWKRKKGKLPMDDQEQADVPSYEKVPPPPMGEVDESTDLEMGGVEPKVVFSEESIPRMPGNPDRPNNTLPPPGEVTDEEVAAIKWYYEKQRANLQKKLAAIEELLGFLEVADDLAVRIAKIERFVGIK